MARELDSGGQRGGQGRHKIAGDHDAVRALVGAITIARAVSDQELSQEILKTVAQLLKTSPRHHGR